uniref:RNA-directed DNA polymerase n=1 Tax=Plectus sambesii TaxID=2011161 RepID=A0A914WQB3_9BILA
MLRDNNQPSSERRPTIPHHLTRSQRSQLELAAQAEGFSGSVEEYLTVLKQREEASPNRTTDSTEHEHNLDDPDATLNNEEENQNSTADRLQTPLQVRRIQNEATHGSLRFVTPPQAPQLSQVYETPAAQPPTCDPSTLFQRQSTQQLPEQPTEIRRQTSVMELEKLTNAVATTNTKLESLSAAMHRNRMDAIAVPGLSPPFFYGYITENFKDFLRQFDTYALRLNLSDDHKLQTLPSYLQGQAAIVYSTLPQETKNKASGATYQQLRDALTEKFVTKDTRAFAQRTLVARKQLPTESFAEYVLAMELAFDNAYPELRADDDALKTVRTQLLMHSICAGAAEDIGSLLLDKEPETPEEAVSLVNRYELYQRNRKDANIDAITRLERKLDNLCKERGRTRAVAFECNATEQDRSYSQSRPGTPPYRPDLDLERAVDERIKSLGGRLEEFMAETRRRFNEDRTSDDKRDGSRERQESDRQGNNQQNNGYGGRNRQNSGSRQGNGRGRGQGRNSNGSAQCHYCGRYGHLAYGCYKNPESPQYKGPPMTYYGRPQAQGTYWPANATNAIAASGPAPQQAITYYPSQDVRAEPTYTVNMVAASRAVPTVKQDYATTRQQQRAEPSDAAQNFYRGNQCCAVQQVPAKGNEEEKRNDINPKAWPGIAKKKNGEMRNDKKRRSQEVRDAGQTSKTKTLKDLISPAIESARKKMAQQVKNEAALRKLASERASQLRLQKAREEMKKWRILKLDAKNAKQPVLSAQAAPTEKPTKPRISKPLSRLLTITAVMLIVFNCFIPISAMSVMGNGPMICHHKRHAAFSLPEQQSCPNVEISLSRQENVRLALYKHNHVAYQTKAYLCKAKRIIKRVFTYFFDTEHLFEDETQTITVNEADCTTMANFKTAGAMGNMVKIADRWQTSNDLKWEMPSAGFSCCKWVSFAVDNAYLLETIVYQKHDTTEMESPAADVKHCNYADGKCPLRGGEFLLWEPEAEEKCRFLPWQEQDGTKYDKYWMNKEGTMAINIASAKEEENCDGPIMMPSQGLAYRLIEARQKREPARFDLLRFMNATRHRLGKLESAAKEDGLVTTDQLASQLQAVHLDAIEAIRLTLGRTIHEACQRQIQLMQLALAGIRARPTQTMRLIFNTSQITARVSAEIIEIFPCRELSASEYRLLPMNESQCFAMLPIMITQTDGEQRRAYLDASTNVIHKDALLAPCDSIDHLPVQFGNQTYEYDYRTGQLNPIQAPPPLPATQWHQKNDDKFLLDPKEFHNIVMHQWSEATQHISMNDMVQSFIQERKIEEELDRRRTGSSRPKNNNRLDQRAKAYTAQALLGDWASGAVFDWAVRVLWVTIIGFVLFSAYRFIVPRNVRTRLQINIIDTPRQLHRSFKDWKNRQQRDNVPPPSHPEPTARYVKSSETTTLHVEGAMATSPPYTQLPLTQQGPPLTSKHQPSPKLSSTGIPSFTTNMVQISANITDLRLHDTYLNGKKFPGLLDCGSNRCLIPIDLLARIPNVGPMKPPSPGERTKVASGDHIAIMGTVNLKVQLQNQYRIHPVQVVDRLSQQVIIGTDWMRSCDENTAIVINGEKFYLSPKKSETTIKYAVIILASIVLTPLSTTTVICATEKPLPDGEYLFEPSHRQSEKYKMRPEPTIIRANNGTFAIAITNPDPFKHLAITANTRIGIITPIDEQDIPETDDLQVFTTINQQTPSSDNENDSNSDDDLQGFEYPVPPQESARSPINFDLSKSALSPKGKETMKELLCKYRSAFCRSNWELGFTNKLTYKLDVGDAQPVTSRPIRIAARLQPVVEEMVREMLERGLITPSDGVWSAPLLVVRKKSDANSTDPDSPHFRQNDQFRVVIDYRQTNKLLKNCINLPTPRTDVCIDSLKGAKYFTRLDCASAFHQLALDPATRNVTGFITPNGETFCFKALPQGLKVSPSLYNRLNQLLFNGILFKFVIAYQDDTIIFSQDEQTHLQHVEEVLRRFLEANLKLKASKCEIAVSSTTFLGVRVDGEGISATDEKIQAVVEFPRPRTIKQVRAFLGLASFSRRMIKDFAKIAAPMYEMLTGQPRFDWTEKTEEAFQTLKKSMTQAPPMAHPDHDKDWILYTDASRLGYGAIAVQVHDGVERPVWYLSRVTKKGEKNYTSVTELEAGCMLWAISKLRHYFYNTKLTVRTDHQSLRYLMTANHGDNSRLKKWQLMLQDLDDLQIEYVPARRQWADALSRAPLGAAEEKATKNEENEDFDTEDSSDSEFEQRRKRKYRRTIATQTNAIESRPTQSSSERPMNDNELEIYNRINAESPNQIRAAQMQDADFKGMINWLEDGIISEDDQRAALVDKYSSEFEMFDGVLYHMLEKPNRIGCLRQLVVPPTHRPTLLEWAHNTMTAGHFGIRKSGARLAENYWWPTMSKDIVRYCNACLTCAFRKPPNKYIKAKLRPIPTVPGPFRRLVMDTVGPIATSSEGRRHILVVCCQFSKYTMAFALNDIAAPTIARTLVTRIFLVFGVPEAILSDMGTSLIGNVMQEVYKLLGIKKLTSSPAHAQTCGQVEKMNGVLIRIIQAFVARDQHDWPAYIPFALMAINSSVAAHNDTPHFLVFGHDVNIPPSSAFTYRPTNLVDSDSYAIATADRLAFAWECVQNQIERNQSRSKNVYDKDADDPLIFAGDLVMIKVKPAHKQGLSEKLRERFHGPYRVNNVHLPDITVTLLSRPRGKQLTVHVNRCKRYRGGERVLNPQQLDIIANEGSFSHAQRDRSQKKSTREENATGRPDANPPQKREHTQDKIEKEASEKADWNPINTNIADLYQDSSETRATSLHDYNLPASIAAHANPHRRRNVPQAQAVATRPKPSQNWECQAWQRISQLPPTDQIAIQIIITSRDLPRLSPMQQQNFVQDFADSLPGLTKAIMQPPPQPTNRHVISGSCWSDPMYLLFVVNVFVSVEMFEDLIEALLERYLPTNIRPIFRIIVSANDAQQMAMISDGFAPFHALQGALQVSGTIERQLQARSAPAAIRLLQLILPNDYDVAWHQLASFLGALACLTSLPDNGLSYEASWDDRAADPHYVRIHYPDLDRLREECQAADQGNTLWRPQMRPSTKPLPRYTLTDDRSYKREAHLNKSQATQQAYERRSARQAPIIARRNPTPEDNQPLIENAADQTLQAIDGINEAVQLLAVTLNLPPTVCRTMERLGERIVAAACTGSEAEGSLKAKKQRRVTSPRLSLRIPAL